MPGRGTRCGPIAAWHRGTRPHALETTLAGDAARRPVDGGGGRRTGGERVVLWPQLVELHVSRVRQRVARGGRDVRAPDIERRYARGRLNLVRCYPDSTNSSSTATARGGMAAPASVRPRLLLRMSWRRHCRTFRRSRTPHGPSPLLRQRSRWMRLHVLLASRVSRVPAWRRSAYPASR